MDHPNVALVGFKGSGKTTAANYLVQEYSYKKMSLAGPLKEAVQTMFRLSDSQLYDPVAKEVEDPRWGMTPRKILQLVGTEVGRQVSEDVWIKNLLWRMRPYNQVQNPVVVDDCRFVNEAQGLKDVGTLVIGIRRPGLRVDNHASELEMKERWSSMVDTTINNDQDLDHLYEQIERAISS